MPSVTLTERDEAVLERLSDGPASVETLAAAVPCEEAYLRTRLPALADNGVVERVNGGADAPAGGERYSITPSGRRALANEPGEGADDRPGPPAGRANDDLDTPTVVDRRIESFDLRPDRETALRNAVSFLHYWGEAHASEIVDAVYSEEPAGFESWTVWWTDFVRDRLAALPLVERPDDPDDPWRYTAAPGGEAREADGREVATDAANGQGAATDEAGGRESTTDAANDRDVTTDDGEADAPSVKYALERSDLAPSERAATRAAFEVLLRDGPVSADVIRDRVYPDHDAGYETSDSWWDDGVRDALASLPGVDRIDGDTWQYSQTATGPASSDPGSDTSDDPL